MSSRQLKEIVKFKKEENQTEDTLSNSFHGP